jgi:hypothetical protein
MAQELEINVDVAPGTPGYISWVDSTVCYASVTDGETVFNQAAAERIRVMNDQHRVRAQGATKLMHGKTQLRPMRDRRHGETIEEWEAGVLFECTLTAHVRVQAIVPYMSTLLNRRFHMRSLQGTVQAADGGVQRRGWSAWLQGHVCFRTTPILQVHTVTIPADLVTNDVVSGTGCTFFKILVHTLPGFALE